MLPRIFGDYTALRCDYTGDDYLSDIYAEGVTKSVYVQANWANDMALEEVSWVQSVSDRLGYPHAIVGYADIASPLLPSLLDLQMKFKNFRGVRQQLHWHKNPKYQFAKTADLFKSKDWLKGFAEIDKRGLSFELQVFSTQMSDAYDLVCQFPNTKFILTHAGMLESNFAEDIQRWSNGVEKLSKCPNLFIKLSGLGTFSHTCEMHIWEPVVDKMIALYGADRCMFGSNFPVEKLWTNYSQMISVIRKCIAKYSLDEQNAVLHGTAEKVYNI
jgi:predicted TIM-barrel fold metal-dependent hydrolase